MTENSIISTLDYINIRFVRKLPLIFTIIGSIGFIGNVITFVQPNLRKNTFCLYSLLGSFIDVLNLFINLLPNYIYETDNILLIISNTASCRWKLIGLVAIPQLSMNLLILSLIDRYSCTCSLTSPLRKMRELKYIPYFIFIATILSIVMSLYAPLLYEYVPGFGCVTTDTLGNGISYVCIQGLLTPLVMLIFVCLTFRNVKQSRRRVGTVIDVGNQRTRYQFINTVIAQVIVTSFFLLQWMAVYLYHTTTFYTNRTYEGWVIHYFIFGLTNAFYYINNIKSFYLSTLTSRLFRETLMKSLLKLFGKMTGKPIVVTRTQTINGNTGR